MDNAPFSEFIPRAPFGYSLHKIILNEQGKPVDFVFLEVNSSFEKLTGLKASQVRNHTVTQLFPEIRNGNFNWITFFGNTAVTGVEKEFEQYFEPLKKWYKGYVFSPEKNYFAILFLEISKERKQAIEFEAFFSLSLDLLCIADLDGNFLKVNKEWENVLGYSVEELQKKKFWEFVHSEDMDATVQAMSRIGKEQTVLEFVNRFRCKDGSFRYLEWRSFPKGNLVYAAARDITHHLQVENELKQSEKRYKSIISVSNGGGWEYHLENGFLWCSAEYFTMLGYDPAKFLMDGTSNLKETWIDLLHPDDREQATRLFADYLANGSVGMYENYFRLKHKAGDWVWILSRGQTLRNQDGSLSDLTVGMHIDITERKRAEETFKESENNFRTLFTQMTEMVVLHELVFNESGYAIDYRILNCNPAFTKITGIEQENAIGRLASEVYQLNPPPFLKEYSQVALTGISFDNNIFFAPMDKHFLISAVSPRNGQFATITTDITDVQRANEILAQKNKELENYLYVASHDLRAPLVNIHGFSTRLKKHIAEIKAAISTGSFDEMSKNKIEELLSQKVPNSLEYVFSSTTKMDSLIEGLLQISRTGRVVMAIECIDMNALMEKVIRSVDFQIKEIGADIVVGDLPDCFGDENLLNQLFTNILLNALKYREKNRKLAIRIDGKIQYKKAIFSIQDNGIGISPRHLERIWDVFFKVEHIKEVHGEGIGLSIVKRIADKHKGRVWVESEEDVGSTFYIELSRVSFEE